MQVERLASGLSHEPQVLVAKLNVGRAKDGHMSDAAQYVSSVLEVGCRLVWLVWLEACVPGGLCGGAWGYGRANVLACTVWLIRRHVAACRGPEL